MGQPGGRMAVDARMLVVAGAVLVALGLVPDRLERGGGARARAQAPEGLLLQAEGQWGGSVGSVATGPDRAYVGVGARVEAIRVGGADEGSLLGRTGILGGVVRGIAVDDDVTFVACDAAGTLALAWVDPSRPRLVARIEAREAATTVLLAGRTAWIGDGRYLQVVDVSRPTAPVEIGRLDLRRPVAALALSGNRVYAVSDLGLTVVDVADRSAPRHLGSVHQPGWWQPTDVAPVGSAVWVADGANGIHVVDVHDPERPRQVAAVEVPARHLASSAGLVYAATGRAPDGTPPRLVAIDARDPKRPLVLGSAELAGTPGGLAVGGARAYVPLPDHGLQVLALGEPDRIEPIALLASRSVWSVAARDGRAVVVENEVGASQRDLVVLDVSDPSRPVPIARTDVPTETVAVALDANRAYVSAGRDGLQIIDLADPTAPSVVGVLPSRDRTVATAPDGDVAYVADGEAGLRVADVSDPSSPREIGLVLLDGARSVVARDGRAYVATAHGLGIVDVGDPSQPRLVSDTRARGGYPGRGAAPGGALGVDSALGHAYLALGLWGLSTVDVSSGTPAIEVDGFLLPRDAASVSDPRRREVHGVAVDAPWLYALASPGGGDGPGGVLPISLSDPARPREADWPWHIGSAAAVARDGDRLYLADGPAGLIVLRARTDAAATPSTTPWPTATPSQTTPPTASPVPHLAFLPRVSRVALPPSRPVDVLPLAQEGGLAAAVAHAGGLTYLGVGPRVVVLDVADPSAIEVVGRTPPLGIHVLGLMLRGDRAYAIGGTAAASERWQLAYGSGSSLVVIDVSDPTSPTPLGRLDLGTAILDGDVSDEHAYLALREWPSAFGFRDPGLMVVDVRDPAHPVETAYLPMDPGPVRVVLREGVVLLTGGDPLLRVVDVSDPEHPRFRGHVAGTLDGCWTMTQHAALDEDTLWVACSRHLAAIDVSAPDLPTEVGRWELEALAGGVPGWSCCGGHALAASGGRLGLLQLPDPPISRTVVLTLDVSSSTSPRLAGSAWIEGVPNGYVWAPALAGDAARLYVATGDAGGLRVIDARDPTSPVEVGAWRGVGSVDTIASQGSRVYAAHEASGVQIVDASDPASPRPIGALAVPDGVCRLAPAGDRLYGLTCLARRAPVDLWAADVTDARLPRLLGAVATVGRCGDLAPRGAHVFLACLEWGLEVVDASVAGAMRSVAVLGSRDGARSLAVEGDLALVAEGWAGISVVDLSNPVEPREVGYLLSDAGGAVAIERFEGGAVALAGFEALGTDLLVLDLAVPTTPRAVGRMNLLRWDLSAPPLATSGRYAHVALGGLQVIDLGAATGPVIAGALPTDARFHALAADGDLVYAAAGQGGLWVLRVAPR